MAEVKHVEAESIILIGKGIGGYLSTMMMAKDYDSMFRCGVVISPTTDWFRYGNSSLNIGNFSFLTSFNSKESSIAERYLGNAVDQKEHYVLSRTDNHIHLIKNDTILLIDSYPFNPVQQFQSIRFSYQMIDAGIRFQHKVEQNNKCKKHIFQ